MSRLWRFILLSLVGLWFGLNPALPPFDRWAFDRFLQVRRPYAPPVSPRIAHLDIGQQDLTAWASTRQEYDGLARLIEQLRDEGAQVIVLDLMLLRGEPADFEAFWEQLDEDVVLGNTFDESSRLPPGRSLTSGLLYLRPDGDGLLRSYDYVGKQGDKTAPSLALAAYLKTLGLNWDPAMLRSDGWLQFTDLQDGQSRQRCLPARVLLDERAGWREDTDRNFFHLTPAILSGWRNHPGTPHLVGQVVFVGYVAPGSGDLGSTPLNRSIPKVGIHSLALNSLFQDAWYRPAPRLANLAVTLALLTLAYVVRGAKPQGLLVVWMGTVATTLAAWLTLMLKHHHVISALSSLLFFSIGLALEAWLSDKVRHSRLVALQHLADSEDPLLLKLVGKYQVVKRLGIGGFATVYQAVPTDSLDPSRSVALKIVHPACAEDADFRRRFLREVRISTQLNHPNIVKVHHAGEESGLLYMAMELIEGRPLKHYLQSGERRSPEEVLQVLRPLMKAMAYAHGLKVLHRDLKPDNLMVQITGEPWKINGLKVVDFGLAFDSQASQLTRTGEVFGTLDYLAPERIQGSSDDPGSDQYAIGVIAYEMLAGANPFQHATPGEAILFRLTADPTPLLELRPDLPPHLAEVVTRMLSRDPQQRFASVQAALEALSASDVRN